MTYAFVGFNARKCQKDAALHPAFVCRFTVGPNGLMASRGWCPSNRCFWSKVDGTMTSKSQDKPIHWS